MLARPRPRPLQTGLTSPRRLCTLAILSAPGTSSRTLSMRSQGCRQGGSFLPRLLRSSLPQRANDRRDTIGTGSKIFSERSKRFACSLAQRRGSQDPSTALQEGPASGCTTRLNLGRGMDLNPPKKPRNLLATEESTLLRLHARRQLCAARPSKKRHRLATAVLALRRHWCAWSGSHFGKVISAYVY